LFLNGAFKIVHNSPWPKIVLATTGIHCPLISGSMEDCSIVRVQQLQLLYRRGRCTCPRHNTHSARSGT